MRFGLPSHRPSGLPFEMTDCSRCELPMAWWPPPDVWIAAASSPGIENLK